MLSWLKDILGGNYTEDIEKRFHKRSAKTLLQIPSPILP